MSPAEEEEIAPGADGIAVYTSAKRLVYIEADQACVVQANGDTGVTQRLTPFVAGDPASVGHYSRAGVTWSLAILNQSTAALHATIITVE